MLESSRGVDCPLWRRAPAERGGAKLDFLRRLAVGTRAQRKDSLAQLWSPHRARYRFCLACSALACRSAGPRKWTLISWDVGADMDWGVSTAEGASTKSDVSRSLAVGILAQWKDSLARLWSPQRARNGVLCTVSVSNVCTASVSNVVRCHCGRLAHGKWSLISWDTCADMEWDACCWSVLVMSIARPLWRRARVFGRPCDVDRVPLAASQMCFGVSRWLAARRYWRRARVFGVSPWHRVRALWIGGPL